MAAKKRKQYTDKFRAGIVAMLQSEGYPQTKGALARVSAYCQVPSMTISRWFNARQNPPPNELVSEKKEELSDMFEQAARKYLKHSLTSEVIEDTRGKDAIVAAATATDKMQLLRGMPTEIIGVLPDLVAAMENAGLKPSDVFNNMLSRLNAQASKVSKDA